MRVRIYQPSRTAMQSGRGKVHDWLIEPEFATPRVPEPLMGWVSAADTMNTLRGKLRFETVEDAVSYARRQGWTFTVAPPSERKVVPRNYLDNFRTTRPEDEERAARKV